MSKVETPDVQAVTNQINEMLQKFKLPNFDAAALVEQHHRNIEAMVDASRVANKGAYDVAERQLELFRETSGQLLSLFADSRLTSQDRTEIARKAYESALAGSREVTDTVSKASEQAFAIARQRIADGLEQFRKQAASAKP